MTYRALLIAAAMMAPTAALASQATPATDFEGLYELETTEAGFAVHLGLAVVTPDGVVIWGDVLGFDVDVDGIDRDEEEAIEDALFDACAATAIPDDICAEAAEVITDAVVELNEGALAMLPYEWELDVRSWGWWSSWLGLYPASAIHTADAYSFKSSYILNNNDGASHGTFLSGGVGLNLASNLTTWICADVAIGVVAGQIDQPAGFELEAEFVADRELMCAANLGGGYGIGGTIGVTFTGALAGSK